MASEMDVEGLTRRRDELKTEMAGIGDMRPGSLTPRFRKCGRPNCHCAGDTSPGHGPSWSLTREINGKTITKVIPSAAAVETTKQHISEFRRFRELIRELIEVSDKLCDAKLETLKAEAQATAQKEASKRRSTPKSPKNSAPC
ncbi:MAG: hypothetical protein M0Z41_04875 [Peptococcaceae bacterium]|nr:hypothetical protein [Peptococcaceae bacterium]